MTAFSQRFYLKLATLFFFLLSMALYAKAQNAWNNNTLNVSKETLVLENMTTATSIPVTLPNNIWTTHPISLGNFYFQFGLKKYNEFYVSPYGYIKMGDTLGFNTPEKDSIVIAPLFNNSYYALSYKLIGTAPNRKLVVQYTGRIKPSEQTITFQAWLYEQAGKIQFVYQGLSLVPQYDPYYAYRIFLKNNADNQKNIASVFVNTNNTPPNISYTGILENYSPIAANTCFTWQPDNKKPLNAQLSFKNIQAGCLDINVQENAINESVVIVEKSLDGVNFKPEKKFFVTDPLDSALRTLHQGGLQPYKDYTYRVFTSNGFVNSDTNTATVKTLMPQINGIKKIPGDYRTITALLQEAETCYHIGPDLVIELQDNYSFNAETLPLTFKKTLQNPFIKSVTIRPAAGATIEWSAAGTVLFVVDSVKNIHIDGRAGGMGTSRQLTIKQLNNDQNIILYKNGADSGKIEYCNILNGVVLITSNDGKKVDAFTLSNNALSTDQTTTRYLFKAIAADSAGNSNLLIARNEFSRFRSDALTITQGGPNSIIRGNRFYQPAIFRASGTFPEKTASCIKLMNTEFVTVDSNLLGGSEATWGKGKYIIDRYSDEYNFIHYQSASKTKAALIKNNSFGNIHSTEFVETKMISASGGSVIVEGNLVGTSDSIASITSGGGFWGMGFRGGGTYLVANNFFSGLQGQYPSLQNGVMSYFITHSSMDSIFYRGNDIGGSNDTNANSGQGTISGIYGSDSKYVAITKNAFRGINCKKYDVVAVSFPNFNTVTQEVFVDSNNFHHLSALKVAEAIKAEIYSEKINRFSHNNIYALSVFGDEASYPNYTGVNGMNIRVNDVVDSDVSKHGVLEIFGNRIYSLYPAPATYPSNFVCDVWGIYGLSYNSKIWNNDIRLGIDQSGKNIDVAYCKITGISGFSYGNGYIEHNSIYIGGTGHGTTGISIGTAPNSINKHLFITNNILQIDRVNYDSAFPNVFTEIPSPAATTSAKNIWYSAIDSSKVVALMNTYKQSCNCDVSSFVGNPHFVNPKGDSAHYDLRLGTGSKADSAGTVSLLGIDDDIDGLKRIGYTAIDIGSHASTATINYPIYWSGTVSSAWENPANWIGGKLPDVDTDVIVNSGLQHYPVVNSNATCRSLTVKPGATFTVMSGYTLTIVH